MAENTIHLLVGVVKALADAQIKTWLFGGWAEELSGLRPPGPHWDIDLLYPAQSFRLLDEFLWAHDDAEEIRPKRFTHKRAFRWHGALVEVFLVCPETAGHITDFFGGIHQFLWPQDTLSYTALLPCGECPSASPAALRLYRERHGDVEQAYRRYIAQLGVVSYSEEGEGVEAAPLSQL